LKATGRNRPRNKAQLDLRSKAITSTSSTINQKKLLFSPEEPIDGRSSREGVKTKIRKYRKGLRIDHLPS
jgi:hypothetical protein